MLVVVVGGGWWWLMVAGSLVGSSLRRTVVNVCGGEEAVSVFHSCVLIGTKTLRVQTITERKVWS